jgi:hypothetical protein
VIIMVEPHPFVFTMSTDGRCGACGEPGWVGWPDADERDPVHAVPGTCRGCRGACPPRSEHCPSCLTALDERRAAEKAARLAQPLPVEISPARVEDDERRTQAQISPANPELLKRKAEAVAYIAAYRGTFGLILDLRASRAWGTKWFRLTERQIDAVLASRDREAAWAKEREAKRAFVVAASIAAPERPPITDGLYRSPEGTVYKVQKAVHGSGHLYAKRLEVDPDTKTGTFEYAYGAIRLIDPAWRMTKEDAIAFGALYGCCCNCGRTLTDEKSIEAGIGPICSRRFA